MGKEIAKSAIQAIVTFTVFILFSKLALALSPKSLTSLEAELLLSGSLKIEGRLSELSIRIYIPQEGVEEIEVSPQSWKLVEDELGNRMLEISWNQPAGMEEYSARIKIKNSARYFENLTSEEWLTELAKKETKLTRVSDEMREFVHDIKGGVMEKAIALLQWIDGNMEYDYEALKLEKPTTRSAIEVWEKKKGVSGEFSNLLVALLRTEGIAARVVFSYTLPELRDFMEQPIGHGFAEAFIDGRWVPLDVTFFEAGYLDASHIRFANLLENNVSESMSYKGDGRVNWTKAPLKIKLINYTAFQPELKMLVKSQVKGNEVVLTKAEISSHCMLDRLKLISCVDKEGRMLLQILDGERKFWFCGKQNIHFIFITPQVKEGEYILCPIRLYDELGVVVEKVIRIEGNAKVENITLASVGQVRLGDSAVIKADTTGIFFSPNFTEFFEGKEARVAPKTPGKYLIYFYSDSGFGKQEIEAVKRRDFIFSDIAAPENVTLGDWFVVNVKIKNIAEIKLPVNVSASFQDMVAREQLLLYPNQSKVVTFNLTSSQPGEAKLTILAEGRTLSSYTMRINVQEKMELTFLERITSYIYQLLKLLAGFLKHFVELLMAF